jgi:hypothetical protein
VSALALDRVAFALAAEDLARMLERDGLRCAATLLRLWAGGNGAVAGAMDLILADIAESRPRGARDNREIYAAAARAIRDGLAYTALGVLAQLSGDSTATEYALACAAEQGVEVSL